MTRSTVGGQLGLTQYLQLANLHRPTDPAALAAEIHRLHHGGLKPHDISVALRIDLAQVQQTVSTSSPATPVDHSTSRR
jgi:hypothetical protein